MRTTSEILDDGLRATEKPASDHQSYIKLTLLSLEVFLDIRDTIMEKLTTIDETISYWSRKD